MRPARPRAAAPMARSAPARRRRCWDRRLAARRASRGSGEPRCVRRERRRALRATRKRLGTGRTHNTGWCSLRLETEGTGPAKLGYCSRVASFGGPVGDEDVEGRGMASSGGTLGHAGLARPKMSRPVALRLVTACMLACLAACVIPLDAAKAKPARTAKLVAAFDGR